MSTDLVLFNHPQAAGVERQLMLLKDRFAQVLPATIPPEKLIRTIMISLDRTPKLYECDRQTIFTAAMSAACLGLEVDGATGQAYILPFKQRAQLITGYMGYNTLAGRGGYAIRGAVIREGDGFEFDEPNGVIIHRRKLGNTGRIIGSWARAVSNTLPAHAVVLSIDELLDVMRRAPGSKKPESPWNDKEIGFPAMCEKTAKRRLKRVMPLNLLPQLQQFGYAAHMDEAVEERGRPAIITPERGVEVFDVEPIDSPMPPPMDVPPIIPGDASCEYPDLPPDIAKRATKFVQFLRRATSVSGIETRWKSADATSLRKQIDIAHSPTLEQIESEYASLHADLKLQETGK